MWLEIKQKYPVLYFDASGGILRRYGSQKQPLLFSMVYFILI